MAKSESVSAVTAVPETWPTCTKSTVTGNPDSVSLEYLTSPTVHLGRHSTKVYHSEADLSENCFAPRSTLMFDR